MKTLTVFTPTYNRKHTLPRTYESLCRQTCKDFDWLVIDDGSSDGTREWIESLGPKTIFSGQKFDWMGRLEEGEDNNHFVIQAPNVRIEYVYKPNGGLYTGYNVAYQTIKTELCVCIDSDDYMPDDAVEKIVEKWNKLNDVDRKKYCGIVGLDFDVRTKEPIGGFFNISSEECNALEMKHVGDVKYALRTDLLRKVAPQLGFWRERDFNPHYMQMQILDNFPILLLDNNLCWVEYQIGADSMSQCIFKQYVRSAKSYAKYRLMEMEMKHGMTWKRKMMLHIHYVTSCLMSHDKNILKKSKNRLASIVAIPFAVVEVIYIKMKTV